MTFGTYHTKKITEKYVYRYLSIDKLIDFLDTNCAKQKELQPDTQPNSCSTFYFAQTQPSPPTTRKVDG